MTIPDGVYDDGDRRWFYANGDWAASRDRVFVNNPPYGTFPPLPKSDPPPEKECCGTCRFSKREDGNNWKYVLTCRRFPEFIFFVEDSWCGEYKPKAVVGTNEC